MRFLIVFVLILAALAWHISDASFQRDVDLIVETIQDAPAPWEEMLVSTDRISSMLKENSNTVKDIGLSYNIPEFY